MTWFQIRFEGEGLHVEITGESQFLWGFLEIKRTSTIAGFYTTRYVEATDANAAIALASLLVREELAEVLPNNRANNDKLTLKVDDIFTVDSKDVDANAKGFTFFETYD